MIPKMPHDSQLRGCGGAGSGRPRPPRCRYFIIAAATFLNALTSASMCARVYVGCVQNEIVESASECATLQSNFV